MLFTGGTDGKRTPLISAEFVNPTTNALSTAPIQVPRANHEAILLSTGDVPVTDVFYGMASFGGQKALSLSPLGEIAKAFLERRD